MAELLDEMQALGSRIDELLHAMSDRGFAPSEPNPAEVLELSLQANRLMLAAASNTLGECRRQKPYAALMPVIHENGDFNWVCGHSGPPCK